MLQKIRDRISGWFAAVFLGAIAVVFIFWGIQFESTLTTEAAQVNGQEIPAQIVLQAWQDRQSELQQQLRDELPPELMRSEQQKLIDEFIDRELLVQRAHESGYRVSDRELAETLRQIPALQVDGQFSRDRYAALLRQQGRSESEFEREFRRDLESNQLRNAIAVSSFVTPAELQRRVALEGETREVAYAVIPAAAYAAQVNVTPEAVAAHYEKNRSQFMTPESVSLQYLQLNLAEIAASVEVTEEGLHRFYEENAARNETPERRKASHILVESGSDDAAAKKEAEELAARVRAGEDFAKLAREHSDDVGSKAAGGDLGWATREAYVPEFSAALFGMKDKGEITGPVRTQFGYHIIRLEDVETAHVRSFDEVRAEIEPEYRRDQAQNLFYEQSQQLADESFAALTELDSVAKKLGMTVQTVENFTRQAGGGALGNDRKIIEAAFSEEVLQERQNSPPIQLGDESVVVLRVAAHRPSQQRPLEEVRDEITAQLREEGARKAAEEAAAALAKRVNAGESFVDAATAAGATPTPPQAVRRTGPVSETAAPVAPELVKAVFQAPRPAGEGKVSAGTATLASGDQAVFVVSSVRAGTVDATAATELPLRAQQTAQVRAAVEFSAYMEELRRTSKIERNARLFATDQ
ncbi:MAG TPA: SurA N-terminal domain-containing protein [Steroidobacteraceae bacterium]|nr:SurA N-terminal domain-containing protein [Steroidobacteraceae bacterium]